MTKSNQAGKVRIIGGQWRGRRLPVPNMQGLRPTTDRVKETVFNWLQGELDGKRCLDLFAGAGSLGFEAASRYASMVTMVEKAKPVANQLTKNAQSLQANTVEVRCADALQLTQQAPSQPYELVFLDPPFGQQLLQQAIDQLQSNGWLAPQAWVYLEMEQNIGELTLPESWSCYREKQAGQVKAMLFFVEAEHD